MTFSTTANVRFPQATIALALIPAAFLVAGCQAPVETSVDHAASQPHVQASDAVEAGRYLVVIGGCNDCHIEGYLPQAGRVPEQDWLAGSAIGWRGPWGTTYASNLRLGVQEISEDDWVTILHDRTALPPMPWMNLNQMSEEDARAIYRYISSLGPKGEPMPAALPPAEEPATPFISLEPQNLGEAPPAE